MLFDFLKNKQKSATSNDTKAYFGNLGSFFNGMFDGEKDFAVLGAPKNYDVDYYKMASRAMDLYITNDLAQSGVQRFVQFAVGRGLEIHAQPDANFLKKHYGIVLDKDFNTQCESLWVLWAQSKNVSYDKQSNLSQSAYTLLTNTLIAGDMLVIKRVKNRNLEFQLVDGRNVQSSKTKAENGNKIINGVEINANGEHVAYYIIEDPLKEPKRIKAKDSAGRLTAWLTYASKHRVGTTRGLSKFAPIIQRMNQLDEYTENEVVASATNSRIAATIEHDSSSSGVNPFVGLGISLKDKKDEPEDEILNETLWQKAASRIKKLTNALVINLPKGQKLKDFDTKRPSVNYSNFIDTNTKYSFPALDMSSEIVTMQFGQSYSASRAALKMFEEILKTNRQYTIIDGFYSIIYQQFFELEVLKGFINAPKFFEVQQNGYHINAYYDCRFVGTPIPHIDPVKEVNAVLLKLRAGLITHTQAIEDLGGVTDFDEVVRKLSEELEVFKKYNITPNHSLATEDKNKNKEDKKP